MRRSRVPSFVASLCDPRRPGEEGHRGLDAQCCRGIGRRSLEHGEAIASSPTCLPVSTCSFTTISWRFSCKGQYHDGTRTGGDGPAHLRSALDRRHHWARTQLSRTARRLSHTRPRLYVV